MSNTTSETERTARAQFKDASHELAVGFVPPVLAGAVVTFVALLVTMRFAAGDPYTAVAVSVFSGVVVMTIGTRYWLRHLVGGDSR